MATPNYSYEKRQRELAKKRKAEEKRQRKLTRPDGSPEGDAGAPEAGESSAPDTPASETPPAKP
ncbi:hypothetical protein [Sphaerotilus microaerophilus]|uniref:Uncharacterized protein n=1 Tax=Sphaerotilus microaerophilus TaxID=2914710 RepID=A0ABN6PRM5_9BURK|nr:hypothetical protein [Sphaerotilus sp. FB-5]BDI05741.1 hypothetical protein CATMQ487_27110 [Sphaerotilus sp. FB-5]